VTIHRFAVPSSIEFLIGIDFLTCFLFASEHSCVRQVDRWSVEDDSSEEDDKIEDDLLAACCKEGRDRAPDEVTWGDVGILEHHAELLTRITDMAFHEGEHAA